jgi:hypothetical protein
MQMLTVFLACVLLGYHLTVRWRARVGQRCLFCMRLRSEKPAPWCFRKWWHYVR